MSGHSKWSQIKRQKGVADVRRGIAFTKATNAITIAARAGGENPDTNFKLRLAIEGARELNMPKENIERAIARGVGGAKGGGELTEVMYEGFGPSGVAVMVEAVTDNKQRTVQEVRSTFERNGGRLARPGSVAHLFNPVGEVVIRHIKGFDPDQLLLVAADAGAKDVETGENESIVYCSIVLLDKVKEYLSNQGLEIIDSRLSRKPTDVVKISDERAASSVLSLINKLDELSDVQKVHANFDIPEKILLRETEFTK